MMEQERSKMIRCNECGCIFPAAEIVLMQRIVTKENKAAVMYYFNCPRCDHSFPCYYKDAKVNTLFKQGNIPVAAKRMKKFKRYFNATSV